MLGPHWIFGLLLLAVVTSAMAKICSFVIPANRSKYIYPTQKQLDGCTTIKGGDLKLENVTLSGSVTVEKEGCLRLINVDMTTVWLDFPKKIGKAHCLDGKEKSEIWKNPGLCGQKMHLLVQYLPLSKQIPWKGDPLTPDCRMETCYRGQVSLPYLRCKEIAEDVDISSWFTDSQLQWHAEYLEKAKSLMIANLKQAKNITFPRLKEVDKLTVINNAELVKIEFPVLEVADEAEIDQNPKLEPAIYAKLAFVLQDKGIMKCTGDQLVTNLTQIATCRAIVGNLTLKGLDDVRRDQFFVKEIQGCVTIEDTRLKNLVFLEFVHISGCQGYHILHNNPRLCLHEYLDAYQKTPVKMTGTFNDDKITCDKTCLNFKKSQRCTTYMGDLIVGNKDFSPYKVSMLRVIFGRLIIHATSYQELTFPKLGRFNGNRGPLLQVTNNSQLRSLKMPKKPEFLEHSSIRPVKVVWIENNPKLSSLKQFLNPGIIPTCSKDETKRCYYDKGKSSEKIEELGFWFYAEPILMVILIFLAHFLIFVPIWWAKQGKDDYKQQQEEEWTRRALAAQGKENDSDYRGEIKKNRNGRPSGHLVVEKTQSEEDERMKRVTDVDFQLKQRRQETAGKEEEKAPLLERRAKTPEPKTPRIRSTAPSKPETPRERPSTGEGTAQIAKTNSPKTPEVSPPQKTAEEAIDSSGTTAGSGGEKQDE